MTGTRPLLAARIAGGDTAYGVIVKMPAPALVELIGHTGFDLVVVDTEHGSADHSELEHHLRAADSANIPALVRVGSNDPLPILRALDAGAVGVIVPHVWMPTTPRRRFERLPGQLTHPTVVGAIDHIAAEVTASAHCALCVLVDSVEQAVAWRQRGARIVLFNSTAIPADQLRKITDLVVAEVAVAAGPPGPSAPVLG